MAANAPRRTIAQLIHQAWNEIPDVVGGTLVALTGLGLLGLGLNNYYAKDGDNRRYKLTYVVMRPEDPRAAKIHKD